MKIFLGMIIFLLIFGCLSSRILNAGEAPSTRGRERAVPPYQEVSDGFYKSLNSILKYSRSLYAGEPDASRNGYRDSGIRIIRETPLIKDASPAGPSPKAVFPRKIYRQALALYEQGHYARSRAAFTAFLEKFPAHSLSDNAWYWTGECYYSEDRYDKAFESFRAVLDRFPRSNKRPDALLKMGLCCGELCQAEKGRIYWQQVIDKYPRTPSAALARKYLAR